MMSKIWQFLHSKDLYTWIGHGILGFLITLATGPGETAVAFAYREASDMLAWWANSDPNKRSLGEQARDSFFDLWSPLVGAALALLLKSL